VAFRVLVVEDDRELAQMLQVGLSPDYQVERAADGETALRRFADCRPHLVILDLMLPGVHGMDVCRALRQVSAVPVLVVSGLADGPTKVLALELGADDYLTKPFSFEELRARVKALLRRSNGDLVNHEFYYDGTLAVDLRARRVLSRGREVALSPTEFGLLECLLRRAGEVLSQQELLRCVWGQGYEDAVSSLHLYVHYLRRKIEPDPQAPRYIVCRKGLGYLFQPQLFDLGWRSG